jgi:hypothetical protein
VPPCWPFQSEHSNGYLAALAILVDREKIPGNMFDSISLDEDVFQRASTCKVEHPSHAKNIDPLASLFQLVHQLINCTDREFLEKLVDKGLMYRFQAREIVCPRTSRNLPQSQFPTIAVCIGA